MNNISHSNMKMRSVSIISAIVVLAIASSILAIQPFQTDQQQNTSPQGNPLDTIRRGIGELYLADYGIEYSAESAKSVTGFTKASLPNSIADNLNLSSIRVRDYGESHLITGFYAPNDSIQFTDTNTFQQVMDMGAILVIYSEEPKSSSYDPQKWREGFVNAAPDTRKLDTINGYPAIIITGNPDKEMKSEIFVYVDNLQIDIVSMKHHSDELKRIAQVITKG